ncbi:MAG: MFS transporter, partial [Candidatus Aramenus sulfurataquae]
AGAIPAASVIYLRRKIPETPRYLARIKGDVEGLRNVIKEVVGQDIQASGELKDVKTFSEYFSKFGKTFLVAALLWFLFDIVAYSGILFGPSLIAKSLGINSGVFQLLNEGLFIVPGGLVALAFIDRLGRKPLQTVGFIGMALSLFAFTAYKDLAGAAFSPLIAYVIYGMMNFAQQAGPGSISAAGMLGVELAPTKVRGLVQSLTVASGRIGAALTSFVFPSLFLTYGEGFAVGFLGAVALIAAVITLLFVPETKSKPLEESSQEVVVEFEKSTPRK